MENPWLQLNVKKGPYILESDRAIVDTYNARRNNPDYFIRTNNIPTPFAGDFSKAKILLLQLNPGSEILPGLDPVEDHEFEVYKNLKSTLKKSLFHENQEFPFVWLNPEFMLTGGFKYWTRIFSAVIKNKDDYKKIANKVCCVQYFPYHSKNYQHVNQILDSQKHGFSLVREFIKKPGRMVVVMKGVKRWIEVIPELNDAKLVYLNSTRNPVLTENNFQSIDQYNRFLTYLS